MAVLHTGSQGVGAHVVDILARHKRAKKVVILDLKPPQEQAESPNIVYYKCNVSDKTAVRQTAARIIAEVSVASVMGLVGAARVRLIMSGMFNGVTHKNPWMTPPLSVANVANKIVSVLESGKSSDVKMPLYTNGSPLLRMLPIEIADLIRKLTGANDDMNGFIPPK
eukprot:jgi/Hompol1/682/HPOL_002518-RA